MIFAIIISVIAGIAVAGAFIYFFFIAERGDVYEKAQTLAARGNFTDARALVRTRLTRDPRSIRANYYLSQIYGQEGDLESELKHLIEITRINEYSQEITKVSVIKRIAEIYYETNRYRQSYQQYLDLLSYLGKEEETLARLAFMSIGQGEFELAEGFFRDLISIVPTNPVYRIARGVGLAMLKKPEALQEMEEGLKRSPGDTTTMFLTALQSFRAGIDDRAEELVRTLLQQAREPGVISIVNRLGAAVYYQIENYKAALDCAMRSLTTALDQGWKKEEYDARLSLAYIAIRVGDMEKANDHLMELELQNPTDDTIIRVSDFRMDVEEGIATPDEISPRGFDYRNVMAEWLRNRFPPDAIYTLSGLRMEDRFDVISASSRDKKSEGVGGASSREKIDPAEMIERFNALSEKGFQDAANAIIQSQGFRQIKGLPRRDKDGVDYIAVNISEKSEKALFSIRQWANQPISDIFLRNMQNQMNELKVSKGFVVAGARLTPGAEQALQNLKKITVINEEDLGRLLMAVLR